MEKKLFKVVKKEAIKKKKNNNKLNHLNGIKFLKV